MIIISNTKYYRNSCSHLSLNHRSHWVKSKRKCQKKNRGDCLGLFVLATPAGLEPATPYNNKFAAAASN